MALRVTNNLSRLRFAYTACFLQIQKTEVVHRGRMRGYVKTQSQVWAGGVETVASSQDNDLGQ